MIEVDHILNSTIDQASQKCQTKIKNMKRKTQKNQSTSDTMYKREN